MSLDELSAWTGLSWQLRRFVRGGWELAAWIDDGRGIAILYPDRAGCLVLVRIDGVTCRVRCALEPSVIADVIHTVVRR